MNIHETAGLLAYFGSAWPRMELPDDTADIWARELADTNADDARDAAKNLVRSSKFFPSIAEFLDECRMVAVRRRIAAPPPALEASTTTVEFPAEDFAALRSKLKDWTTKGHNHKGPEPCPVCSNREVPA